MHIYEYKQYCNVIRKCIDTLFTATLKRMVEARPTASNSSARDSSAYPMSTTNLILHDEMEKTTFLDIVSHIRNIPIT